MKRSLTAILCVLAFGLLGSSPFAASSPTPKDCIRCDAKGVLPCKKHSKEMVAYEAQVLFCSMLADCTSCSGALLVDCDRCEEGSDSYLILERQTRLAEWMKTDRIADHLGHAVGRVETTHFQLIVNTGEMREGKKKVDQHTLLHRIANDVEHVASQISDHYSLPDPDAPSEPGHASDPSQGDAAEESPAGNTPQAPLTPLVAHDGFRPGYFDKPRMWIWDNPKDHKSVMETFLMSGASGDFKMLGKRPVFSVWTEDIFNDVRSVRSLFAHNASHMLLSNLYKELWVGDLTGGWFDAGSGHWYEYEIFGRSTNACLEEASLNQQYHQGVWRAALRKELSAKDRYFLPKLLPKNSGAMEIVEQAICWSFYDWLVAKHKDKLPTLLDGLKREEPGRDLLMRVLGKRLFDIEDDWRAWVKETYPKKEPKPRRGR